MSYEDIKFLITDPTNLSYALLLYLCLKCLFSNYAIHCLDHVCLVLCIILSLVPNTLGIC